MKRALLAGVTTALLTMGVLTHMPASGQEPPPNEGVCEGTHVDAGGTEESIEITAPEGFLISQVCVKAGSIVQGDGPEYTTYNPPVASVTLEHSSGKGISHYVVTYVPIDEECPVGGPYTEECPEPTTTTSTSTTTTSTSTTSTSTTSTTIPTTTTSEPPTPTLFAFGGAATVCQATVPVIQITFANTFPELAGETGVLQVFALADESFVGEVEVTYEPGTTVEFLYPGAVTDDEGNIIDLPGWILQDNGLWVIDESDAFLREGLLLEYTLGEEVATAEVTYPPESSTCANPPPPGSTTTTTVPGETTTTFTAIPPPASGAGLPSTGSDIALPVAGGLALIGAGLALMDLRRVKRGNHMV